MRRVGELLAELGFNKEAPLETQKAFLKHLVQAADRSLPPQKPQVLEKQNKNNELKNEQKQLSFSFGDELPPQIQPKNKNRAS